MDVHRKISLSNLEVTDLVYLNAALIQVGAPTERIVLTIDEMGKTAFRAVSIAGDVAWFDLECFARPPVEEPAPFWDKARSELVSEGKIRDVETTERTVAEQAAIQDRERVFKKSWQDRFTFYELVVCMRGNDGFIFDVTWIH